MFDLIYFDANGNRYDIGSIKIGFKDQPVERQTYSVLPTIFASLGPQFFSLGQTTEFYKNCARLGESTWKPILSRLRDVVVDPYIIDVAKEETVFSTSLLRSISLATIRGQFSRVLHGMPELTDYKFKFVRPDSEDLAGLDLSFNVKVDSKPSTNIHAIIGRNGVGKTTLLNGMIDAITKRDETAMFIDRDGWEENVISADYFSSLVSVSFSAFDPFSPPQEQSDPAKGTCYFYIGLKNPKDPKQHLTIDDLWSDCAKALIACFSNPEKTSRWLNAISKLGSDENFASMQLTALQVNYYKLLKSYKAQPDSLDFRIQYLQLITPQLESMSSGHAVVLLTITRLVARVEEKTLVLLDEPESHLHPPLLSAFVRALADLLHDRNGVAIIATHSPVVLQEIPKSCVWKIHRVGKDVTCSRPSIETFGENVGLLTSEVFSLEVIRSGFHNILAQHVAVGGTFEDIVSEYKDQLGFEARAILRALIANRDRSKDNDAIK
jgi:predicted ATPase